MSYALTDIDQWAKVSESLARYDQSKKLSELGGTTITDLDIKLYVERKSLEYAYNQDPSSADTFQIGQWVLSLIGIYLFEAQQATGGGGTIVPVTPSGVFTYPLVLVASNFQPNGITFINNNMPSNDKLKMWVSNYSEEWYIESTGFFVRTSNGFVITQPGFNMNNFNFIIVDKYVTI
jgi:hypothetical protein